MPELQVRDKLTAHRSERAYVQPREDAPAYAPTKSAKATIAKIGAQAQTHLQPPSSILHFAYGYVKIETI